MKKAQIISFIIVGVLSLILATAGQTAAQETHPTEPLNPSEGVRTGRVSQRQPSRD